MIKIKKNKLLSLLMLVLATKSWANEGLVGAGSYRRIPNILDLVKGKQKAEVFIGHDVINISVYSAVSCVMPKESVFLPDDYVKTRSGEVVHIPAGWHPMPRQTVLIPWSVKHALVFDRKKDKVILLCNSHEERLKTRDLLFLDSLAKEALLRAIVSINQE